MDKITIIDKVNLFCVAIREGNKEKIDAYIKEAEDEKLFGMFLLISIKARCVYSTERLFGDAKIRYCANSKVIEEAVGKAWECLVEDQWIEGISCLPSRYGSELQQLYLGGFKKIIKQRWMDGFKSLWKKYTEYGRLYNRNINDCAVGLKYVFSTRWMEALKFIIYHYETATIPEIPVPLSSIEWDEHSKYESAPNPNWIRFTEMLLRGRQISDLEYLLDNDLS